MPSQQAYPHTLADDIAAIERQVADGQIRRYGDAASLRKRRRIIGIAIGVIAAGLIALAGDGFNQTDGERAVTLQIGQTPAQIWRANASTWSAAPNLAQLGRGDTVRTGPGGGALLTGADGTIIKLAPGTVVSIQTWGYSRQTGGRRRALQLYSGRIWVNAPRDASADSYFDIRTSSALTTVQDARISVLAQSSTSISVESGAALITARGVLQRTRVSAGQAVVAGDSGGQAPVPFPMPPAEATGWQKLLAQPGPAGLSPDGAARHALTDFEEQFLVRPMALLASVAHIGSLSGEDEEDGASAADGYTPGAYKIAMAAARRLQSAMELGSDPAGGYPASIGLSDLSGVNMGPEMKKVVLESIAQHQLVAYQREAGRYEIYIRALRPSGALIRITPDAITVVPDVQL